MKKIIFNLMLFASLLFMACNKDSRDNAIDVLSGEDTLLSKMNQIEGATSFISLSSHAKGLGHKTKEYRLAASLADNQLAICDNISLNNDILLNRYVPRAGLGASNQFLPNKDMQDAKYAQLFGTKVQFNMNSKPNQTLETRTESGGSIDVPNEIEVNIPNGSPITGSNAIAVPRNVPLRWNPARNNRSVYILVLFDPQSTRNFQYRSARRVTAFHTVRDNGSFTIPASDFNGIPAGGHIEILVARGNTILIGASSNGLGSTALMTYSMATIRGNTGGNTGGSGDSCPTCIEVNP